jgi:hypothetical protein
VAAAATSIDALVSADSHVVPLPTFWRIPAGGARDRAPRREIDDGEVAVFEGAARR